MTDPGFFGMPSAHRAELDDRFTTIELDVAAIEGGASGVEERVAALESKVAVSVTDFGAVASTPATGHVDATAAFQAAIDFVEDEVRNVGNNRIGGTVFIPAGLWNITTIEMKTRVGLLGASRSGTILRDFGGTGAMIQLDDNLVNFTDLRNFMLLGGSNDNKDGIDYVNATDTNSDHFLDVGDPFHIVADLDIYGFSGTSATALTLNCRASLVHNINIHQCTAGIRLAGSDNKVMNCDISWIFEEAFVISGGNNKVANVKVWFCGANPPGTATGQATFQTADGFVINSNRNTLIGCEAQDISRHGLHINGGDENRVDVLLDNIGNFFVAQGHGFEHPTTTQKCAVFITGGTPVYNKVGVTLGQRSSTTDLQALVSMSSGALGNHVEIMAAPDRVDDDAPAIHFVGATAGTNVVEINGERRGLVTADIAIQADDGTETIAGGANTISGTDSIMNNARINGWRFEVPNLPQGATILDARMNFTPTQSESDACDILIDGEDADASLAFGTVSSDISGRARTTAQVTWSGVPAWTSGTRNYHSLTPNLATVVQEIVDRAGFGGVVTLFTRGQTANARRAATFESSSAAPTLYVAYEL